MHAEERKTKQQRENAAPKEEAASQDPQPAAEAEKKSPAPEEAPAESVETPDAGVAELEAEIAQLKDQLLRALAETENLRRRSQREKEEALKYAAAPFAKALLPVADNLQRALAAVPEDLRQDERAQGLLSGLELTAKELSEAFSRNGVEAIEPLGQKLDPHWHEALFEVPDGDSEPGVVVQVVEVGYRLGDRLLRPARVGVARKPS